MSGINKNLINPSRDAIIKLAGIRELIINLWTTTQFSDHNIVARFCIAGHTLEQFQPNPLPDTAATRSIRNFWTTNKPWSALSGRDQALVRDLAPSVLRVLNLRRGRAAEPEPDPSPSRQRLLRLLDRYSALVADAAHKLPDMQLRGHIAVSAFLLVSEYSPTRLQRALSILGSPMKRALTHPDDTDWAAALKTLDARLDAQLRAAIARQSPPAP